MRLDPPDGSAALGSRSWGRRALGGVRRWFPWIVGLGTGLRIGWLWGFADPEYRQGQVMGTQTALGIGGVLGLFWVVFLSPYRWRTRLRVLGALGVVTGGFFACFRYAGVSGDLVPVFEFRWRTVVETVTGRALTGVPGEYPGFLGPHRSGGLEGPKLATNWDARPPALVWRRAVGKGWSGFAVAGNRAITQEQQGPDEVVVCYDLASGAELWKARERTEFQSSLAGDGPRSTPTIVGNVVVSLGATGALLVLDIATGVPKWTRNVLTDARASVPTWGLSCSPLVEQDLVVVTTGAKGRYAVAAYRLESGSLAWTAGDDGPGYSSPMIADILEGPQIVLFHEASAAGYHPADGRRLWAVPWPDRQPNVAQPLVVSRDGIVLSSGYGVGTRLLGLSSKDDGGFDVDTRWRSVRLKSKFANMILHGGSLFGLDDGVLACLDPASGQRLWKEGRYGHGQMIRVGDLLLVMAENGEVVLLALDREQHRELARFQAIDGKVWNPPALAGSRLLVRNDREAALFLLPLADGG